MNPDVNPQVKFDLPNPTTEVPIPVNRTENVGVATAEAPGAKFEAQPGVQEPMPPFSPSLGQVPQAADSSQPLPSVDAGSTPAAAEHNDSIEKEWIDKVRHIVAQTRMDPYQQSQQLAALRADYIQKRYGKTVKLS